MSDLDLRGRRAWVGGASQGIGEAIALALASRGCSLSLLARNAAALEALCARLPRPAQQEHGWLAVDFSQTGTLAAALETLPRAEILILNSGGPSPGPAHAAAPEAFAAAFAQHLLANQTLLQQNLAQMRSAGYGRVITVLSTSVKQPIAGLGVSNTIRGAVAAWAKTLASELGPDGITVNNVLPGYTDTKRLGSIMANKAAKAAVSVEAMAAQLRAEVPAGRFADPAETAAAVAFLASPQAGYINGINLPVDGGRTQSL
ncbi:MAG: SDR family oxidoreductase [Candidatus Sericytochromatia bacterium]|nr:SDR family oxidoreductase [Candidatus Sericytochromatia bacterium]